MNNHLNARVIVLDQETLRPMSWDDDQFVFVSPIHVHSKRQTGFKLKTYKKFEALELIKANNEFRAKYNMSLNGFMLMLVL
jgi:hypothetical protein